MCWTLQSDKREELLTSIHVAPGGGGIGVGKFYRICFVSYMISPKL